MYKITSILLLFGWMCISEVKSKDFGTYWFGIENDFMFNTDRYYSNGIESGLIHYKFKNVLNPKFRFNTPYTSFSGLTVQHSIFTPEDHSTQVNIHDRPFAAYVLFNLDHHYYLPEKSLRFDFGYTLGLIGPWAGGAFIQNSYHKISPLAGEVTGWGNQLSNSPLGNVHLKIDKGIMLNRFFSLSLDAAFSAGTPYTYVSTDTYLRLGLLRNQYSGPLGMDDRFTMYLEGKIGSKYKFYDTTLTGGWPFKSEIHALTDFNHFVHNTQFGLMVNYKKVGAKVGITIISPEYEAAEIHKYGHAILYVHF